MKISQVAIKRTNQEFHVTGSQPHVVLHLQLLLAAQGGETLGSLPEGLTEVRGRQLPF
jgi:hypothetical protein